MMAMGWWLAGLGVLVGWLVWCFNRLVALRNKCDTAWSDVDVQLLRRHELIPNLVALVKGYNAHESALQQAVALARGPLTAQRLAQESATSAELVRLLAVVEAYPELKAEGRFGELHQQLVAVEEEIQMARRYFNGATRDYNNQVQSFPALLVARSCGFASRPFFEVTLATVRQAPEVRL